MLNRSSVVAIEPLVRHQTKRRRGGKRKRTVMDAGMPILELGRPSARWRRRTRKVDAQAWAFLVGYGKRHVPGGTVVYATEPPGESTCADFV